MRGSDDSGGFRRLTSGSHSGSRLPPSRAVLALKNSQESVRYIGVRYKKVPSWSSLIACSVGPRGCGLWLLKTRCLLVKTGQGTI
jgi:hypothetical protein